MCWNISYIYINIMLILYPIIVTTQWHHHAMGMLERMLLCSYNTCYHSHTTPPFSTAMHTVKQHWTITHFLLHIMSATLSQVTSDVLHHSHLIWRHVCFILFIKTEVCDVGDWKSVCRWTILFFFLSALSFKMKSSLLFMQCFYCLLILLPLFMLLVYVVFSCGFLLCSFCFFFPCFVVASLSQSV